MNGLLRVLIVEDSEDDVFFILRQLKRGGYSVFHTQVDTAEQMQVALRTQPWDIVIADYMLPSFNAPAALEVLQHQQLDLPFIIVSGNIGEDIAVAAMKAGAHDYLMKNNLTRLVPAVERELREARERQQRRRAEQALRESEERFRSLIENALDIITILTPEGLLNYASPSLQNVLGYPPASLAQQPLLPYIHCEDVPHVRIMLDHALHQPGPTPLVEFRFRHQDDSWRTLEAIGQQLLTPQGHLSIVINARDITDRKQAEEIRKQLERERQLRDLKTEFFSMMSHELKNPLGAILAAAELLEHYDQQTTEEKKYQFFQVIKGAIKQITNLLNDTLIIGQAEAGKLEYRPAPLALEAFCLELVEQFRLGMGHQHVLVFEYHNPHSPAASDRYEPFVALMDQDLLHHIFGNLLSNAIKYSPQGSTVRFTLEIVTGEQGEAAIFRVQDRGMGIPPQDQLHLFDTFHRASNVGKIPGTGLGMAIVKKCVDLHQGEVSVESELGVGSTFTIVLPLGREDNNA